MLNKQRSTPCSRNHGLGLCGLLFLLGIAAAPATAQASELPSFLLGGVVSASQDGELEQRLPDARDAIRQRLIRYGNALAPEMSDDEWDCNVPSCLASVATRYRPKAFVMAGTALIEDLQGAASPAASDVHNYRLSLGAARWQTGAISDIRKQESQCLHCNRQQLVDAFAGLAEGVAQGFGLYPIEKPSRLSPKRKIAVGVLGGLAIAALIPSLVLTAVNKQPLDSSTCVIDTSLVDDSCLLNVASPYYATGYAITGGLLIGLSLALFVPEKTSKISSPEVH